MKNAYTRDGPIAAVGVLVVEMHAEAITRVRPFSLVTVCRKPISEIYAALDTDTLLESRDKYNVNRWEPIFVRLATVHQYDMDMIDFLSTKHLALLLHGCNTMTIEVSRCMLLLFIPLCVSLLRSARPNRPHPFVRRT